MVQKLGAERCYLQYQCCRLMYTFSYEPAPLPHFPTLLRVLLVGAPVPSEGFHAGPIESIGCYVEIYSIPLIYINDPVLSALL